MDPLAGYREKINEGELEVLTWLDHGDGCPVAVGQIFRLRTCHVEIKSTRRVGGKGRPWYWRATFERSYADDRPHLLGPRGIVHDPDQAIEAQDDPDADTLDRVDESDRSEEHRAIGEPPEPEGVPMHQVKNLPTSVAARARYATVHGDDVTRRNTRSAIERLREASSIARANGVDITPELDQVLDATASIKAKVARAA